MLNFETFKHFLYTQSNLRQLNFSYIGDKGQNIAKWSGSLAMKPLSEQCQEVERLLAEMSVALIDDERRLDLMAQIYPAIRGLISRLHQQYIYDSLVISMQHLHYVDQIKTIFYLSIIVFQGVVDRAVKSSKNVTIKPIQELPTQPKLGRFKRLLGSSPSNPVLQGAVYIISGLYLNLLKEEALLYKKPPDTYWAQLNKNYLLALKHNCSCNMVDEHLRMGDADSIEAFYKQASLASLLQLNAYRRQDIKRLYKVLPKWASYIELKREPSERLRVFINLKGSEPPQYLSPSSKINPYDDANHCLFVDLANLKQYLQRRIDDASKLNDDQGNDNSFNNPDALKRLSLSDLNLTDQQRLVRLAYMVTQRLEHKEEQRKIDQGSASIISGFRLIHYYMAGRSSFFNIINQPKLDVPHQPKYNTKPSTFSSEHQIKVDVTEVGNSTCRLRWEYELKEGSVETHANIQVQSLIGIKRESSGNDNDTSNSSSALSFTSPTEGSAILAQESWELGLISSIDIYNDYIDIVVRIIGTSATACGIRLDNKDGRRQDYVPALLLAGNENLGTQSSLIVAKYHFKVSDKIILRIGSNEAQLKLQELKLKTDDIEQYTLVRTKHH